MSDPVDPHFYERADAVIQLANEQNSGVGSGNVSASLMYATARFNAWLSACGFNDAEEMQNARQETLEYFTRQYRAMLEENLDDYIRNFGTYM